MKPIRTPRTNASFVGVEVLDLPCRVEDRVAYSSWDLDPAERIAIAEGALIELAIRMDEFETIPAVSLIVDSYPREV